TIDAPQQINIFELLKEAVCQFDKCKEFNYSFKTAHVHVEALKGRLVPCESSYDAELHRILSNWLELVATSRKQELDEHYNRAMKYAKLLNTSEVWFVHFTCEDNATKNPHWPAIRLLKEDALLARLGLSKHYQ
ncbi:18128_t:CDS:2, partial [Dentiscutata erythropus]